jgi:ABC-2 type transport system permease protein
MGKLLILVRHELRLLLVDRQALGLLFLMPLVFIVFLTLALQDVYLAKVGRKVRVEYVAGHQCDNQNSLCARLLAELQRMQFDIAVSPTPTLVRSLTIILPVNMDSTVELIKKGGALGTKDKLQLVFDPTLDQSLRALVEANLMLALQSVMIAQAHEEFDDVQHKLERAGLKVGRLADVNHLSGLIEERSASGSVLPNPIQQTVPAWALFGMFFIVIPMANSMIRDRRLGIFKRLLSFPVRRAQLLAGKILPFFILNMLQFALMFLVGVLLLPRITHLNMILDFSYWSIFVVTAACVARTTEQASAFGALSVVILAIMGGVMIPRFVMPEFMQQLGQLSPLHWGLEAYLDIIVRKADLGMTLNKLLVLIGFGSVCLTIARLRFRWQEAE